MTNRKAWQTLLWMSALFLINKTLIQNEEMTFLRDKTENLIYSGIELSLIEMFPVLMLEESKMNMDKLIAGITAHLQEEVFPTMDYCWNYWENRSDFVSGEEEIPEYFLETDEEETEVKQEIEEQIIADGARTYTENELKDFSFLLKTFYTVDSTTTVPAGELNGLELASKDLTMNLEGDEPKILIYHTHGSEGFADSTGTEKEETIIGVGDELARILEETYGIKVIHDRSFYDSVNGKLDRSKAYTYAGNGITKTLKENPSIEVVIDLHRDAVKEGNKLVTEIEGKQTAKIMFFNGLSRTAKNGDIGYLQNPYKEDNLAFSLQMQLAAAKMYPGFTRKIYLKGYRYNLHLKPRSLLIEVGAQTNTKEEAKNAMEPLAKMLYQVLHKG